MKNLFKYSLLFTLVFSSWAVYAQNILEDVIGKQNILEANFKNNMDDDPVYHTFDCVGDSATMLVYLRLDYQHPYTFTWDLGYVSETIKCCDSAGYYEYFFYDDVGMPYKFSFSLHDGTNQDGTVRLQYIAEGVFHYSVIDEEGHSGDGTFITTYPPLLELNEAIISPSSCVVVNDGAIDIDPQGGTGGYNYLWSTLDGAGIINGVEDQTTLEPGHYYLTLTDSKDCETTAEYDVPFLEANAGSGVDQNLCSNIDYDLMNALVGADFGGEWYDYSNASDMTNSLIDLSDYGEGIYKFRYSFPENGYCPYSEAVFDIAIEEYKTPGLDTLIEICADQTIVLSDYLRQNESGGIWRDENREDMSNIYLDAIDLSGVQNYYYGFDMNYCPDDKATISVQIEDNAPKIKCPKGGEIHPKDITLVYLVEEDELDPISVSDDCKYLYYNDFNNDSTLQGEYIKDKTKITWRAFDSAGNESKCSFKIRVIPEIPNLITPNGDGKNDTWDFNIDEYYTDAIVTVYNRLGKLVYQSLEGYPQKWNGTDLSGAPCRDGSYHFNIINNDDMLYKGFITILR